MTVRFLPDDFVRPISDKINCLVLIANTAQAFTVPTGYTKVLLAVSLAGQPIWIKRNGTAAIPSSSVSDGTCPMLNPCALSVKPGDTLSCISSEACIVTAEFYN
jgi:hypothetical protein